PELGDRDADRVEELQDLDRRGRRAYVDRLELVQAEGLAQLREDELIRLAALLLELGRDRLALLLEADPPVADLERPLEGALSLLILLGLDHCLESRFQ